MPPTAEEIDAFENDRSDDAFARVVDRLLASPRYGERWGRHWLDVARYADTKDGVLMFGDDRVRPYAYTYRDYVIRAFNEDLAFDRFIHEQLAADVVAPKDEPWRLAAMGFLTLGRMFDNNIHDQIDDRIDTVTRGLLGLTVACARCHDHKYDAIPHGRLLLALRRFRQQRDAPRAAPDRAARTSCRAATSSRRKPPPSGPSCGSFSTASTSCSRRPPGSASADYLVRAATTPARPARDGDLLRVAGSRGPAAPDRGPLAALSQAAGQPRRPGLRPLARPDELAGRRLRGRGQRRPGPLATTAAGNQARPVEPAGRGGPGPRLAQDQGRRAPGSMAS